MKRYTNLAETTRRRKYHVLVCKTCGVVGQDLGRSTSGIISDFFDDPIRPRKAFAVMP